MVTVLPPGAVLKWYSPVSGLDAARGAEQESELRRSLLCVRGADMKILSKQHTRHQGHEKVQSFCIRSSATHRLRPEQSTDRM